MGEDVLLKGFVMKDFVIGVPRERKEKEGRVGVTPSGVRALREVGEHVRVMVELGAGRLSGFSDRDYLDAGAAVIPTAAELYETADIIVKVKEPIAEEYPLLESLKGKMLFTYLHLAGVDVELTRILLRNEITAIAYENVEEVAGGKRTFPLLVPMSRIAGTQGMRLAKAYCAAFSDPSVVIIGGGNVGEAALKEAIASGITTITVFDLCKERVLELRKQYGTPGIRFFSTRSLYQPVGKNALKKAAAVISGVMNPGGSEAPKVLTAKEIALMREGALVVDVAIDQGGSTEYSRPTHPGEVFKVAGVFFSCVANIPGSTVPAEATMALTQVTLPYVKLVAEYGTTFTNFPAHWLLIDKPGFRQGLQTWKGNLVNEAVSSKHQLFSSYKPLDYFF